VPTLRSAVACGLCASARRSVPDDCWPALTRRLHARRSRRLSAGKWSAFFDVEHLVGNCWIRLPVPDSRGASCAHSESSYAPYRSACVSGREGSAFAWRSTAAWQRWLVGWPTAAVDTSSSWSYGGAVTARLLRRTLNGPVVGVSAADALTTIVAIALLGGSAHSRLSRARGGRCGSIPCRRSDALDRRPRSDARRSVARINHGQGRLGLQRLCDFTSNVVLNGQDVAHWPVIRFRPDDVLVFSMNQTGGDPHGVR
jgi:hypothetical protein